MARRYDPEFAVADRFKAYLEATLSEALTLKSPVVTFYDPMAQDDAARIVVFPQEFDSETNSPQNWSGEVQITVKSQCAQKTMKKDIEAHADKTNEVREALLRSEMLTELNNGVGLGISFISRAMKFKTDVVQGWIYSDAIFDVKCHAREAADDVS